MEDEGTQQGRLAPGCIGNDIWRSIVELLRADKREPLNFAYKTIYENHFPKQFLLHWSVDFYEWLAPQSAYTCSARYLGSMIFIRLYLQTAEKTAVSVDQTHNSINIDCILSIGRDCCGKTVDLYALLNQETPPQEISSKQQFLNHLVEHYQYLFRMAGKKFRDDGWEFAV